MRLNAGIGKGSTFEWFAFLVHLLDESKEHESRGWTITTNCRAGNPKECH